MKQEPLFPYVCHCGGVLDYHQAARTKNIMKPNEKNRLQIVKVPYTVCLHCWEMEYADKGAGI